MREAEREALGAWYGMVSACDSSIVFFFVAYLYIYPVLDDRSHPIPSYIKS